MLWRFIDFIIIIIKNVEQSNKNYCKYSEFQFAWALKNLDSKPASIYLLKQVGSDNGLLVPTLDPVTPF